MARTVSSNLIMSSDATHIKDLLRRGYSILDSIGAHGMRLQMVIVGYVCRALIWLICLGSRNTTRLKRRAATIIKFFFPTTVKANFAYISGDDPTGAAIYFNHQSLFEVLAALWHCLTTFPNKNYYFPMNLPWYEGLARATGKLALLGIYVTPLITPNTYKKLEKATHRHPENIEVINYLKDLFDAEYSDLLIPFLEHGDIIAVAPSATRTPCIFPSYAAYMHEDTSALPATMTKIVFHLRHVKFNVYFIPFVATRAKPASRGLNVWRRHDVYIGHVYDLAEMREELRAGLLDYNCFLRLAGFVPEHLRYPHE